MKGFNRVKLYGSSEPSLVTVDELAEYINGQLGDSDGGSGEGGTDDVVIDWIAVQPLAPWSGYILLRKVGNRVDVGMSEVQLTTADNIYQTDDLVFMQLPEEYTPKAMQTFWGLCSVGQPMIQIVGDNYTQMMIAMYESMGQDVSEVDPNTPPPIPVGSMLLVTKHLTPPDDPSTENAFGFTGCYFLD